MELKRRDRNVRNNAAANFIAVTTECNADRHDACTQHNSTDSRHNCQCWCHQ